MKHKIVVALTFAVLAALMLSSVASAITIVVDGVREAAWGGVGVQIPGSVLDPNEAPITDARDIERFQWTNDQTNMYILVQTYANTTFTGTPVPTIVICLNTDNAATGGSYANCNGMTGIDRSIVITRFGVDVIDSDPNTGTSIGTGTRATVTNITEVSVSLSDLGFSTGTCPSSIPTAIYFDNGILDPDDTVPDGGTILISCGSPTAVTLNSLQAQPVTTSPVLPLALVGGAAVILIGTVLVTRRSRKHSA